jgi:hypothetical protein
MMNSDPASLEVNDVTVKADRAGNEVMLATPFFEWHIQPDCAKALGLAILRCADAAAAPAGPDLGKLAAMPARVM